ncbi:MAG TPA: hypothetical protein EYP56_18800 [Planctomycetaceae bacterium]|nr:hypothetical protein [Planctomycetaceae bacterium]HIQ22258.1 hypothetical protein [Planctomycetota bacterium]
MTRPEQPQGRPQGPEPDTDPLASDDDPLGLEQKAEDEDEDDEGGVFVLGRSGASAQPQPPPQAPPEVSEAPDSFDVSTLYEDARAKEKPEKAEPDPYALRDYLQLPDKRFSQPRFFRVAGRAAGCAGLVAVLLTIFRVSWLTPALVLLLAFLVGEAAAVILEAVGRLEKRLGRPPSEERPS